MQKRMIKLKKIPSRDILLELIELMVYHKMSYPVGAKDVCTVNLNAKDSVISTPDTTYVLSDDLFVELYLLSNKAIANLYKTVDDDKSL